MRPGTLSAAERSYPKSEVSGSGRECQAVTAQERPRGATLRLRPEAARISHLAPEAGAVALRSHPALEARDGSREGQPQSSGYQGAGGFRGAIPR